MRAKSFSTLISDYQKIEDENGWTLVPMRRMKSAFDDNTIVKTEQYARFIHLGFIT